MLRVSLFVSGLLITMLVSFSAPHAFADPATIIPSIPTEGGTWTSPSITILIMPQLGPAWYKPSYAYDVNRAISRWSQSIIAYTDAYGTSYLRQLSFTTCVSGINESSCGNPDVIVQFIQSFGTSSAGLGLTSIRTTKTGIFQAPTTTTLAAFDPSNSTQLSDKDMVNIASHEFGHALGLNHANTSGTSDGTLELMFLSYAQIVGNPANSLEAPSSLDLYALSYVYNWLATSSTLTGSGNPITTITLPSGIAYSSVYPYPEQIQMVQNTVNMSRLEVIVLAVVAAILLALVLTLVVLLTRKKEVQAQTYTWQIPAPPAPAGSG